LRDGTTRRGDGIVMAMDIPGNRIRGTDDTHRGEYMNSEIMTYTRPAVDRYAYRSVILFYVAYHKKDPEPNFNSAVNYLLKKALELQEEIEK
jgi:hypothetical protein